MGDKDTRVFSLICSTLEALSKLNGVGGGMGVGEVQMEVAEDACVRVCACVRACVLGNGKRNFPSA